MTTIPATYKVRRGFGKAQRILKSADFRALTARDSPQEAQAETLKLSLGPLLVFIRPNGRAINRLGLTVSKKVLPRAVDRNRLKRRLRELFRLRQPNWPSGYDVVVIGRSRAAQAGWPELNECFALLARRAWPVRGRREGAFGASKGLIPASPSRTSGGKV